MKKKILDDINKRIKSKMAMINLIIECCQEEDQKDNMIHFKAGVKELESLYKFIKNIKK